MKNRNMNQKMDRARSILKSVFGYDSFWPLQGEIISHVLEGKDALVVMPTGGGKSICYQVPALIFNGLTVVVSPLISLMKDQVDQLRECGVPAACLNSTLDPERYRRNVDDVRRDRVKLLYVAPEALMTPRVQALLSSTEVSCLAVDEAHCISDWGHDFRPEYRQLAGIRSSWPQAVCMALTATATERVRSDIRTSLQIEAQDFIGSFNRSNLYLEVVQKEGPRRQLLNFMKEHSDEPGIIYCFSRQQTEDLTTFLNAEGYSARPYHAGLSDDERTSNQELFIRDDIQVIVATIAFGMGINKPNVRFVVHYDLPKNIESYYQEIGRAGRDGLPAHCLLLFGYGDLRKIRHFIMQKNDHEQMVASILLNALLGYAETELCRRVPLLGYFDEAYSGNCEMCDNCRMGENALIDINVPAQMFLSCVKRTGEGFGASHIIEILRGSQSAKVLNFGHEKLSTYGIGTMHSARKWRNLFRQFVQKGLLVQEFEHGTLRLTEKAWRVLRGRETIFGRIFEEAPAAGTAKSRKAGLEEAACDQGLFELLRKKRKEIADEAKLPPYVIFHDRTLLEMTSLLPRNSDEMSGIYGVGAAKIARYGDIFLEVIAAYLRANEVSQTRG